MRRHRWVKGLLVVFGTLVVLAIVVRLVVDPIAAHYTRKALNEGDAMRGTFSSVHVSLVRPGYEIKHLKIIELPGGDWKQPLLYAENTRMTIVWSALFRGHLVAWASVYKPKLIALNKPEQKPKKLPPDLTSMLQKQVPFKIDRLEVIDGEVLLAQGKGTEASLWLNDVDMVVKNLATRRPLMGGEAATLRLDARVQRSGKLVVDANMDPFAKQLTFSIKAALRDLELREVYGFMAPATKLKAEQGKIDLFSEIHARQGQLTGGVKPVLTDVELASAEEGLGARIKAALADVSMDILEDDRGDHDVAATTIPIKGSLTDPHLQLVPAVLGAVRNAFVVGLSSGFKNLPPPTSGEKEGVLKQAWHSLKKDEGPPKAQPDSSDQKTPAGPRQGRAGQPRPRQQQK
jgi:hypothetical protein